MTDKGDSKELSYYLRHDPAKIGVTLDKQGWTDMNELIKKRNTKSTSTPWTRETLELIAAEDAKGRYSIDGDKIRANQGHSLSTVKIDFKQAIPPVVLYHGTPQPAVGAIWKSGLLPMNRHHVHMTDNIVTAIQVGERRRGKTVIFQIDSKQMFADGIKFYLSDNGVWLTDVVAPKYLMQLHRD